MIVRDLGFDGIDINMGCPETNVNNQGSGASLILDPPLAEVRKLHLAQNDFFSSHLRICCCCLPSRTLSVSASVVLEISRCL
jgi:hypothetical protein